MNGYPVNDHCERGSASLLWGSGGLAPPPRSPGQSYWWGLGEQSPPKLRGFYIYGGKILLFFLQCFKAVVIHARIARLVLFSPSDYKVSKIARQLI